MEVKLFSAEHSNAELPEALLCWLGRAECGPYISEQPKTHWEMAPSHQHEVHPGLQHTLAVVVKTAHLLSKASVSPFTGVNDKVLLQ